MSTQAEAKVVGGTLMVVCGGVAVAGAAAIGLLVGAGVLVHDAIMWIGDKIDENYKKVVQEWIGLYEAARAEGMSNQQIIDMKAPTEAHFASVNASLTQTWPTAHITEKRMALDDIFAALDSIDMMLKNAGVPPGAAHRIQKQAIETHIKRAEALLEADSVKAFEAARSAQQAAHLLLDEASETISASWEKTQREVIMQRGVLAALTRMTEEAAITELIDAQKAESFRQRISAAESQAQALAQSTTTNVQPQFSRLNTRIESLKEEIFEAAKGSQQKSIAQNVASTLAELGFQSHTDNQPVVSENGNVIRVEAMRAGDTPNFTRDDKLVSFDITRNGDIRYDFSGYVGDSCVHDAEIIFAALREKGIFILDAEAANRLPRDSTIDTLTQAGFQPHFTPNKVQAALAERLKSVLEQMRYATIRQSSVGGSIEIEAFEGPIGYHVVLSPEGPVQVFKDAAHADVSDDVSDPVVAEVQKEMQEESLVDSLDEQQRTGYVNFRKQQLLGH